MRIGWISCSDDLNELISHLSFAKHEIVYLSYNQGESSFNYPNVYKANTIKELIEKVDIIFTYFKKSSDLYRIYTLTHGIYDTIKEYNHKVICIDLSLTSVNLVKKIISKNPQVDFIEAPVIKTVKSNGKMSYIMPVSGKKYLFDKVQNILADFEIEFFYVGSTGTSQIISTANNILKSSVALGLIEAINYAKTHDLDLDLLFDSVSNGAGRSELLVQFFSNIKNDYFDIVNKNFFGSGEQLNSLLLDNRKNSSQFLLAKVLYGILKKSNINDLVDLDLKVLSDFYHLNLGDSNEIGFNASFISHPENIFEGFNEVQLKSKTVTNITNIINNVSKQEDNNIGENKLIKQQNENIINNITKGFNNGNNDELKVEPIINSFINNIDKKENDNKLNSNDDEFIELIKKETVDTIVDNLDIDNKIQQQEPIKEDKKETEYNSPESLAKFELKNEIKEFFEEKVDEELGSLKESDSQKEYYEDFHNNKNNTSVIAESINDEEYDDVFGIKNLQDSRTKTLIFDLDGTLLNSKHTINSENVKLIKKTSQEGHEIVIATGRSFQQTIDAINTLGVCKYAILNNGAIIFDIVNNLIIQNTEPLSNQLKSFFLKIAFKFKTSFLIYSELDIYGYFFKPEDREKFTAYINDQFIDLSDMKHEELERFINSGELNLFNVCPYSKDMTEKDWLNIFDYYKNDLKECNLTSAIEGYVDIYPSNISKYYGYLKVKELLNLHDDDVYFFGDSNNDYDLMSHLKNGIAMGNANEKLKSIATFIIGNNDEDSIANFIKNKILI